MLRLVLPDSRYLTSYVEALREGHRPFIKQVLDAAAIEEISISPHNHFEILNYQGGITSFADDIPFNRIPYNHYWAVEDGVFIGGIDCRFSLNERLLEVGGHIGYVVRPSLRKKGYATKMVALALEKLKERGVQRVLISCDEMNIASIKVIESNGGILENKVPNPFITDSKWALRYWIDIK